jgi:hypothetical protein
MNLQLSDVHAQLALMAAGLVVILILYEFNPRLGGLVLLAIVLVMIFAAIKRSGIGG